MSFVSKKSCFMQRNNFNERFMIEYAMGMFPNINRLKVEDFIMKKLLVLMMLILSLSVAGCNSDTNSGSAAPASSETLSQNEEGEFTPEQRALAQEFADMIEAYNEVVDRVNQTPEALADEELVATMNELSEELTKADEAFASSEILTDEVMEQMKEAIDATNKFITEANAALDEIEN